MWEVEHPGCVPLKALYLNGSRGRTLESRIDMSRRLPIVLEKETYP